MKKRVWEHRIPTIPAFLLLMVGMWVTLYLVKNQVSFNTRASPDTNPTHLQIGNVTDSSFTVGFTTRAKVTAGLKINVSNQETIRFDDRDMAQSGKTTNYAHIFTIKQLQANTTYSFTLLLNGQSYTNNGTPYTIKTGPVINAQTTRTIKGSALLPDGDAADDALIVIEGGQSQTLIAVSQAQGSYTLTTPGIRTKDLSQLISSDPHDELSVNIYEQDFVSHAVIHSDDLSQIPPIALSQDYSFVVQNEISDTSSNSAFFSIPVPSSKPIQTNQLTLISPKDNQTFIDAQPQFKGTAPPGQKVKIIIHSTPLEAEVLSDKNGAWSFRPNFPLSQGSHTISIQMQDSFGILRSVTKSFAILPSGSQVAESATPSATPTISPTLAVTATPVPTSGQASPTPTGVQPTVTSVPTAVPTVIPTAAPTVQATLIPTSTPFLTVTPTKPGSTTSLVVTLISVLFIIAGTTLLFVVS